MNRKNGGNRGLYPDVFETLNKWYDEGHVICFFTSRTEEHRGVNSKMVK